MARAIRADRLRHILDAIADVQACTEGKSYDDYLTDDMRHAVERCLEIVSEASRYVPREAKARHAEIPWRGVADFGNVLRHDFLNVKDRRVWEIMTAISPPSRLPSRPSYLEGKGSEQPGRGTANATP